MRRLGLATRALVAKCGSAVPQADPALARSARLGGLYALIAVINAVALAAAARKRELAVARLSGLTRGQTIRTSALEALAVSAIGVILGAAAAACCLLAARRGFLTLLGEPVLVIPWATLLTLTAVSITAVVGTATIGTWLANRTNPITLAAARE
ncbi:FtsX-like permease family protein [Nocardioides flavus (ex Wang et al. 2016)]|uniref:FtsX-like permease family protein n=1 Tax=Nocardioides flavus (ex Wang et al. 2016) TaxID=2058780 RepID=UPI00174C35C1|nr:FtsX-like permease family protein [Nocardioides flavus (ex Wang et al. 2016)]